MLTFFSISIILLIVGIIAYLSTLDGSYHIRRSQLIKSDIYSVFDKIKDLKSWSDWSPWIIHEPTTTLEFSDNFNQENGFYTWNGQHIGTGKLTHIKFDSPHLIKQRLEFTKPYKFVCDVGFELVEKGDQTEITWYMNGKMPFLFRFMTEKTKNMISKDYDFGLLMLNNQLDANADCPILQFEGETTLEPLYSLCESFSGGIKAMEVAMKLGFPKLASHIETHQGEITSPPFTAYHKTDIKNMQFECDMAIPVSEGVSAGEFQLKTLGGGRYYKITVSGSYQFLELAWYSAISHICMLKLKQDKKRDSLEVYENDPELVEQSRDLKTSIYIPIK